MGYLIYLFGSGLAFFLGIGLILAAVGVSAATQRKWLGSLATISALVGLVFVAFSATPLPYTLYGAAGLLTFAWLAVEKSRRVGWQHWRNWLRAGAVAVWLLGVLLELPYHLAPTLTVTGSPPLYILGDSVAACLDERETGTWPRLLARSRPIVVHDFSRMGATAASALRQAERLPEKGGIVLLEVGGNDLLGSTTAVEFERDLGHLLDRVCQPGRTVLMFELPLPPFCNEYGRIQRRLASWHGVLLIPKRVSLAVLTGAGATLDSVHLAREGHERMAEAVWKLLRPAYQE